MKTWQKRGLIGLGVAAVIAAVALAKMKPLDVDTWTVKKTEVAATVLEKGKVVSEESRDIFSEAQGKVLKVNVDTGDAVAKGKVLALLDPEDIRSKIAQLEGELKAAIGSEEAAQSQGDTTAIKQQQLALEQAKVAYDQAKANYERSQALFKEGGVTKADLDQAKADFMTKEKAVAQAEAALAATKKLSQGNKLSYQGRRESIQAQLNFLKQQLAKTSIAADRDGVVLAKKIKEGDVIAPGALMFTIGKTTGRSIEAYFDSKDLVNAEKGDQVEVIVKEPGQDVKVKGEITKISPVTEEKLSSLGILEDKIKVTIEFKDTNKVRTIPGMTVDVDLITQKKANALAVPKDAVFSDQGQDYVWVIRAGKAQLTKVEIGIEGDELVEVRRGLDRGDEVITNPHQQNLKEGIRVQ